MLQLSFPFGLRLKDCVSPQIHGLPMRMIYGDE